MIFPTLWEFSLLCFASLAAEAAHRRRPAIFIGGGSSRDKTPTVAPSFLSHAVYFALINLLLILPSLLPILFDCQLV
jgi:hypothetical protein